MRLNRLRYSRRNTFPKGFRFNRLRRTTTWRLLAGSGGPEGQRSPWLGGERPTAVEGRARHIRGHGPQDGVERPRC